MITEVFTSATLGVDAYVIRVETHIERGLHAFQVVGLPDSTVKESRNRVSAAIKNSGLAFPGLKKITINLSPADIRKAGSSFDLAIAVGLLCETGQVKPESVKDYIILGELSLDGKLRWVPGVLPIAIEAKARGFKGIVLPEENATEAAVVDGLNVYPFTGLNEVVSFLSGNEHREPVMLNLSQLFESDHNYLIDFTDIKGQAEVKRAMEIAAAGAHNIIMIGLPGSGKTMLARRLSTILPPMTLDEALETTKIHSIAGLLTSDTPFITKRPFRSPHHTASDISIVGGGSSAKLGEISLAHNGVLFLDEFTEFRKNVMEALRQPLEDGVVTISRIKMSVKYPCNFMLVAAMNPSPAGSAKELESYNDYEIQKFLNKISGPILDRIDMHIHVNPVPISELSGKAPTESSESVRERVVSARKIQTKRFINNKGLHSNSRMTTKEIREFCKVDKASEDLLRMATTKLGFSARAYDKILKIARTISDLAGEENIQSSHISEAIQYRSLDRSEWI